VEHTVRAARHHGGVLGRSDPSGSIVGDDELVGVDVGIVPLGPGRPVSPGTPGDAVATADDTTYVIEDPTATRVAAIGVVATTVPRGTPGASTGSPRRTVNPAAVRLAIASASGWPMTSGTSTSWRFVLTTGRISDPASATVPAGGS
jgi:hypothetical protein